MRTLKLPAVSWKKAFLVGLGISIAEFLTVWLLGGLGIAGFMTISALSAGIAMPIGVAVIGLLVFVGLQIVKGYVAEILPAKIKE